MAIGKWINMSNKLGIPKLSTEMDQSGLGLKGKVTVLQVQHGSTIIFGLSCPNSCPGAWPLFSAPHCSGRIFGPVSLTKRERLENDPSHMPVAKVSCLGKQSLSRILKRAIPTRQIGCIHSLVAYTLNHHGHKLFLSVSFAEYIIMYIYSMYWCILQFVRNLYAYSGGRYYTSTKSVIMHPKSKVPIVLTSSLSHQTLSSPSITSWHFSISAWLKTRRPSLTPKWNKVRLIRLIVNAQWDWPNQLPKLEMLYIVQICASQSAHYKRGEKRPRPVGKISTNKNPCSNKQQPKVLTKTWLSLSNAYKSYIIIYIYI